MSRQPDSVYTKIVKLVEENQSELFDNQYIKEKIDAMISQKMLGMKTTIVVCENKRYTIPHTAHPIMEKMMILLNSRRPEHRNCLLFGDAGSGKTYVAKEYAKLIEKEFYFISCSGGTTRTELLGRFIQNISNGSGKFYPSQFLHAFENGGVCLLDELSAAQSDMIMVINSGLANGYIYIPERIDCPRAERHKDFVLIATANTITGTNNLYSGQNPLDGSILDRFKGCTLEVNYAVNYEEGISQSFSKTRKFLWDLRKYCKEHDIPHTISTRIFEALADYFINNPEQFKDSPKELLEYVGFFADWSEDEINMIQFLYNRGE